MSLFLSDLPPALLAGLRSAGYINGTGPRTIKALGLSFRSPCSIPTPGGKALAEQHDLDYLVGGPEVLRLILDAAYIKGLRLIADGEWLGARLTMLAFAKGAETWLKDNGAKHWHKGTPRDIQALWRLIS